MRNLLALSSKPIFILNGNSNYHTKVILLLLGQSSYILDYRVMKVRSSRMVRGGEPSAYG